MFLTDADIEEIKEIIGRDCIVTVQWEQRDLWLRVVIPEASRVLACERIVSGFEELRYPRDAVLAAAERMRDQLKEI